MIQLSDLRVFVEIVARGGFSEAARRLKIPKSSVTRQIDRLETTLDAPLFRRSTRSVALTPEGQEFLPRARRLLDDGIEAENTLRSKSKGASGLLAISATGPFARAFLVPHLPAFKERHPGIEIALWLTPARIEVGPDPGQVDIAIRLRSSAAPHLATRKLGDIEFWIVASPAYLARRGAPASPQDLVEHSMVELGPPNKAHQAVLVCGKDVVTVRYKPWLQIDDPEAVTLAAEAGAGIAMLPSFLASNGISSGRLVRVLPNWAPAAVPINVLYRTDTAPPTRVTCYVDHLFETVGESQPWLGRKSYSPSPSGGGARVG